MHSRALVLHHPDVLERGPTEMSLVIRDQKTSARIGNYKCPVPSPILELLAFWLEYVRPCALHDAAEDHDFVFFNVSSGRPFKQPAFSSVCKSAFKRITGHNLDLQSIRRVFADGMPPVSMGICDTVPPDYLSEHAGKEAWGWLAASMLTSEEALRRVYFFDGFQRQSFQKVCDAHIYGQHVPTLRFVNISKICPREQGGPVKAMKACSPPRATHICSNDAHHCFSWPQARASRFECEPFIKEGPEVLNALRPHT